MLGMKLFKRRRSAGSKIATSVVIQWFFKSEATPSYCLEHFLGVYDIQPRNRINSSNLGL